MCLFVLCSLSIEMTSRGVIHVTKTKDNARNDNTNNDMGIVCLSNKQQSANEILDTRAILHINESLTFDIHIRAYDANCWQVNVIGISIDFRKTTLSAYWHHQNQAVQRRQHEMTHKMPKKNANSLWPHRYVLYLW